MERLGGFKTQQEQQERFEDLKSYADGKKMQECNKLQQTIVDYGFFLTPSMKEHLTLEELKEVEQVPSQIACMPYQPKLLRFMDEKYVDEFIKKGTLMLTTVGRCHHLEDPNRTDKNEGRHTLVTKDCGSTIECCMGVNDSTLMLCTTLNHNNKISNPLTGEETTYKCALEIMNPSAFMQCITQALLQRNFIVTKVVFGPCMYADGVLENRFEKGFIKGMMDDATESKSLNKLFEIMGTIGQDDVYFKKPLSKSFEQEYRFVWEHGYKLETDTFIIEVPEARKFCAKRLFK